MKKATNLKESMEWFVRGFERRKAMKNYLSVS